MLVLTRRINESIIINDNVVAKVLGIQGNQVRIGIQAPKSITVHREEVYERILAKIYTITSEDDVATTSEET